jgi:mannosylfructose-phosphate synthase
MPSEVSRESAGCAPAGIAADRWREVCELFDRHGLPHSEDAGRPARACDRVLMVSTHGYWSDPPPAGATDTGGQTLYVLQISKEWARAGRQVIILARWFDPYPRVERLEENLFLVRVPAGDGRFVRKEDIYPLAPQLAEEATCVAARFGARAVMGHYADGMVVAAEVATRLSLPFLAMPHSLAATKIAGLGLDAGDLETWFDAQYSFRAREECELAALAQADCMIGCMPDQLAVLSTWYQLEARRDTVTPGVAPVFFAAADEEADGAVPARFGLEPGRYLIVTSRLAETKNIAGAVALLGEARALAGGRFDNISLALVGGNLEPREPEEMAVERKIEAAMARYGLSERDVRRIPAQTWSVVAQLLRQSLFYVGMQHFEPFGMGPAEALAAGAPVLLSQRAGIVRILEEMREGPCALFVDPTDPRGAARRLLDALAAPERVREMVAAGKQVARDAFSWPHAAHRLGRRLDGLVAMDAPARRRASGGHRLAGPWRGDSPRIAAQHMRAAEQLIPHLVEAQRAAARSGRRLVVAIGGESGAGKTEIAHCLHVGLRRHELWSALLPGDVFFRLPPRLNHEARLRADQRGQLADYLGPPTEVDIEALDRVLASAADLRNGEVHCPSDCRQLTGRRYERVPLDLSRCQVVLVDLTYAMLLDSPALRIFLESDYLERVASLERRHAARDPDQDLAFVMKVLAIEHQRIQRTSHRAHLTVDAGGAVRDAPTVERAIGAT